MCGTERRALPFLCKFLHVALTRHDPTITAATIAIAISSNATITTAIDAINITAIAATVATTIASTTISAAIAAVVATSTFVTCASWVLLHTVYKVQKKEWEARLVTSTTTSAAAASAVTTAAISHTQSRLLFG